MSVQESHGSSKSPTSMRTPLGRVRRFGAAHHGTSDFFRQRITALAMVLLIIPLIAILFLLRGRDQAGVAHLIGSPLAAIALILFIISCAWHMKIGVQIVIEDYVHGEGAKLAAVIGNNFFSFVVAAASIFAIVKLSVGS